MALQDIVNVQISKQTASVSRIGFGTPLIMSAEASADSRFTDTAKIYTDIAGLGATGDNFDATGVTFLKAQAAFSQNPRPDRIVIGKRANLPLQTNELTPVVKDSTAYTVTIGGEGFTFTSDATATAVEIIQGLETLINAGAQDVLATDQTTFLRIEKAVTPGGAATAGKTFTISYDRLQWAQQNVTPDPGVAADLSTIQTAADGNDDWYCALLDSAGKAEIEALAASIEAVPKIFIPVTSDSDVLTSSSSDVGSNIQASNYARTALMWHQEQLGGIDAAWAGELLPSDPGSVTWKFKSLAGPAFTVLTPSEDTELAGKSVNRYVRLAGNNITCDGVTASGEFIDVTRGIDFITARLREHVFAQLIRLPKIPFTNPGIAVIENEVRGVMDLGISQGIFAADPPPVVAVPLAADVDVNDKANRLLPDVTFTAVLAGAIHAVEIRGIVTL